MKVKLEMVIELGEMDVAELAKAVEQVVSKACIPNPDGGVMFIEYLGVVIKDVRA